jgi:flagellar motor switch protein FliN
MGRPSETAEKLLGATKKVPRPKDAPRDVLYRCSFFRTWPGRGAGDGELDRITSSIDQAFHQGTLGFLEELEYVASTLSIEVIRVDRTTGQVLCGFGGELGGAAKTVVLLGTTLLAEVSRPKASGHKPVFQTDLRKKAFPKETLALLLDRHARACASNYPVLSDAVAELRAKGKADYQVVLDPFKRVQAAFVPGDGILPVSPTTTQVDAGVPIRRGYSDLREEELPTVESQTAFADTLTHPLFAIRGPIRNVNGAVVELDRKVGDAIDVYVNDRLVARGEVVIVDDKLGVTMTEIVKSQT